MTGRPLGFACLLTVIVVAAPAAAQGTPRSVAECERLKNDLAYNQCLAMFGPAAKNVGGGDGSSSPGPVASAPIISSDAAAAAGIPSPDEPELQMPGRRGRHARSARRGGRQSMSFAINTGSDETAGSGRSRRSHRSRRRH